MAQQFPRLFTKKRQNYRRLLSDDMKQLLMEALSPEKIPWGRIREIQRQTGIPRANLDRWRSVLLHGGNPWAKPKRRSHYGLPEETERAIYEAVISRVNDREFCPRSLLRSVANFHGRQVNPDFKAGRSWVKRFMSRHGLSFRRAHSRRRTKPNDAIVASFLQEIEVAREALTDDLIFNMDETAWRLFNGRLITIARRGTEDVSAPARVDEKANFTVLCTVTLSGRKLPPWVIIRGTTDRCEQSYRNDPRLRRLIAGKKIIFTHSKNGWATHAVMRDYIKWLSDQAKGRWSYLIWDLHVSHRNQTVKDTAAKHCVNLAYVPAGQTSVWQPLDVRVFGALKAHAMSLLDAQCAIRSLHELDMVDALLILAQAWDDLTPDVIRAGWRSLVSENAQLERAFDDGHQEEEWEDDEEEEEEEDEDFIPWHSGSE